MLHLRQGIGDKPDWSHSLPNQIHDPRCGSVRGVGVKNFVKIWRVLQRLRRDDNWRPVMFKTPTPTWNLTYPIVDRKYADGRPIPDVESLVTSRGVALGGDICRGRGPIRLLIGVEIARDR